MITAYVTTSRGLAQADEPSPGCWLHVTQPTPPELALLHERFGVPEPFTAAALDVDELARTDAEDGVTLIIALIPHVYQDDPGDIPFSTIPFSLVLTRDYLITICPLQTHFIAEFLHKQPRHPSTFKKQRLILHLLLAVAQRYLAYLRQIEGQTDAIQRQAQRSLKNRELLELLRYQKSYIYFRTSLESNALLLRRLQRAQLFERYPDDADLLDDVLIETTQAIEVTKIASDILNQMMDTYATIISNNLNDVMKILAAATIILSIPTVLASIYGMNVPLPGQGSPLAFGVILGLAGFVALLVGVIFWRRQWL